MDAANEERGNSCHHCEYCSAADEFMTLPAIWPQVTP
jgi:hypothetical protein